MSNIKSEEVSPAFFVAEYCGAEMVLRLEWVALQPSVIVVLGEAVNGCEQLLKKKYPLAQIITEAQSIASCVQSVDLIFANLVLPWAHLPDALNQWRALLRPEGMILFSTFGPDTLKELAESSSIEVLPRLIDMHDIGDALVHARFSDPVLDVESLTVTYKKIDQLLKELGSGHMIAHQDVVNDIKKDESGQVALSFELVFGHAWGPSLTADYVANEEGVVKIPLAHLRRK